jgi:hypothetical protein
MMMKNILFILFAFLLFSCDNSSDDPEVISGELTFQEKQDLQFLKEEEKLARDVYLYAFDLYAYKVFENISKSEQMHMDRVTEILSTYQIEDLSLPERGKFTNTDLQKIYYDLTDLCEKSLEDALRAGATIEDLDINDIENFMEDTDLPDVMNMYLSLSCGSRNHMRAFTNNLTILGVEYVPQFISEDEYFGIINNSNEKCNF